jgi:hypothetical protein
LAPITATLLAVALVAAILPLHYKVRIDPDQANNWKHVLAMVGAAPALALVGSLFQGGKSHARASQAKSNASTLNGDDSRFFHHVGILWWILSLVHFLHWPEKFSTSSQDKRSAVFDMADPSHITVMSEPLFNLAKAKITLTPCMTLDDIKKGVEEATRRMSSMEG